MRNHKLIGCKGAGVVLSPFHLIEVLEFFIFSILLALDLCTPSDRIVSFRGQETPCWTTGSLHLNHHASTDKHFCGTADLRAQQSSELPLSHPRTLEPLLSQNSASGFVALASLA